MPVSRNRRSWTALLVWTLLANAPLCADDHPAFPPFTGPLDALNPSALPPGVWVIEPYLSWNRSDASFDADRHAHHTRMAQRQWGLALPIQYGITRRLSLHLIVAAADRQIPGSGGIRAGDSTVRLLYQLTRPDPHSASPVISVTLAQTIPSGRYQHLQASEADGLGSGSRNTVLGLNTQTGFWLPNQHALRVRAHLYWTVRAPWTRVQGHSLWSTPADFDGRVRVGRQASVDLSAEYSLDGRWVLVGELLYNRFLPTRIDQDVTAQPRRSAAGPGGDSLVLAPAVEYNWNAWIGLIAGAEFTATGRNSSRRVTPQLALNMVF
ncbi:hypothetical protein ACYJW8_09105 [Frateuria aurantia]